MCVCMYVCVFMCVLYLIDCMQLKITTENILPFSEFMLLINFCNKKTGKRVLGNYACCFESSTSQLTGHHEVHLQVVYM